MNFEQMADKMLHSLEAMSRNRPLKLVSELSQGEAFLLGELLSSGGVARSNALGQALGTSSARIAAAVKSMEHKGWVYRKSDEADQRKRLVYLTEAGRKHALLHRTRVRQAVQALLEELGAEDTAEFLRLTDRINNLIPRLHSRLEAMADNPQAPAQGKDL